MGVSGFGAKHGQLIYENGPGLDLIVYFVTALVMLLFAIDYFGGVVGDCCPILPLATQVKDEATSLASRPTKALLLGSLGLVAGIIMLFVVALLAGLLLLEGHCKYYRRQASGLVSNKFVYICSKIDCRSAYERGWSFDPVIGFYS